MPSLPSSLFRSSTESINSESQKDETNLENPNPTDDNPASGTNNQAKI